MAEQAYYHVVGANWEEGDNLLSRDEVVNSGGDPGPYIWQDGQEEANYDDGDIISFARSLDEARAFRDEWRPGCRILAVELESRRVLTNAEGYPCVVGYVRGEHIRIVE